MTKEDDLYIVNIPMDKDAKEYKLSMSYPDHGKMALKLKKDGSVAFRRYDWMGKKITVYVNGKAVEAEEENGLILVRDLKKGDKAELRHPIRTIVKKEHTAGREYDVVWRGCDVIEILPYGEHLRLFQRDLSKPQVLPTPEDVPYTGAANYGPTQQKK